MLTTKVPTLMTAKSVAQIEASAWLLRFAPLIPKEGLVLDLACGSGRHSRYLAGLGHSVVAVDRDAAALEVLRTAMIETRILDLEADTWPFKEDRFAAIVVTNYLYRPYMSRLPQMLVDGGILIYETFAAGNELYGKPSNPDFLLNSGELLAFAHQHGLKVIAYEDIYEERPKPAMIQRICAVKGALKGRIPLQFVG